MPAPQPSSLRTAGPLPALVDVPRRTVSTPPGPRFPLPPQPSPGDLIALQRCAGNRSVVRLLAASRPIARTPPPSAAAARGGDSGCRCPEMREYTALQTEGRTRPPLILQRQPTQAEEAAFAFNNPGKVTDVGSTTGGGSGLGTEEPNEFVFWNYLVGKAELRSSHIAELSGIARRWEALLKANPTLRVKAVGSASTSGSASVATPLSLKRAEGLKAFLVARGIPASKIEVAGVGTRQPLADETTPEGMARNRRAELFLFRPTTAVNVLEAAAAEVVSEQITIGSTFTPAIDLSNNFFALRHRAMRASATVEGSGRVGTEVGYLQFVHEDRRIGRYQPTGGGTLFTLDFSRCTKQYLPCKDVAESMQVFSAPPLALAPGPLQTRGTVQVSDAPGVAFPLQVTAPRTGRLEEMEWSMEFTCVLGVRSEDRFMGLEHFIWRVDAVHSGMGGSNPAKKEGALLVAAGVPGSPGGIDIARAMGLQTCRFTMRRIESAGTDERREMCQPELV